LFESAGLGRSTGRVPNTIAGMAKHALAFLDGLGLKSCDVLGFSLGGMVATTDGAGPPVYFSPDDPRWHGTPEVKKTSCTSISPASLSISVIPSFKDTQNLQKIFFAPNGIEPNSWFGLYRKAD
jgi:pimeloyl-ACP methyl ester carboxylesterase